LLGIVGTADWPKPAADAASNDSDIVVGVHHQKTKLVF
jgi:hypothetical protein